MRKNMFRAAFLAVVGMVSAGQVLGSTGGPAPGLGMPGPGVWILLLLAVGLLALIVAVWNIRRNAARTQRDVVAQLSDFCYWRTDSPNESALPVGCRRGQFQTQTGLDSRRWQK